MRLLLVEDDKILGDGLQAGLTMEGYAVDWLTDGSQADEALKSHNFDLVVLDLGLPGMPGDEVLKRLRKRKDQVLVLILTARDTVTDRVQGLDSGADDFVVKPFDLNEICARIRAMARRMNGQGEPHFEYKGLVLDPASHLVKLHGNIIDISNKEFEILSFLMQNQGKVASRARLEETLYAWNSEVESNTIEVHIHHLRKKLGNKIIRTVRGVGYIIDEKTA
jgi:two-component system OmpR family response regulator/two-component system response regulator QseB